MYERWISERINYSYGAHIEQDQLCAPKLVIFFLILMLMLINDIYLERYVTIGFYSTFQQKLPTIAVPGSISRCGRITLVPANNAKVIARY